MRKCYLDLNNSRFINSKDDLKGNYRVGSFTHSIVIKNKDDNRVVRVPAEVYYTDSIKEVKELIRTYKTTSNIIIDFDSIIFIYHTIKELKDNFLIYESSSGVLLSLFEYAYKMFNILTYQLDIKQIRLIMYCYIMITKSFNLPWNANKVLSILSSKNVIDNNSVLLQYLKELNNTYNVAYTCNMSLVQELQKYIKNFEDIEEFRKYPYNVSLNDLITVLKKICDDV